MNSFIIDTHVHLYPDGIAERITMSLGEKFGNEPAFTASVNGCLAHEKRSGIACSLNLPVATSVEQVSSINHWAQKVNESAYRTDASQARVFSLAALHPQCPNLGILVEEIALAGFMGIKFHPEYQHFRYNDTCMNPCWEAMSSRGLVAYLHAGGERVFNPPFHSSPTDLAKLHARFPKLKIVAAHLGGWHMWDEVEAVLPALKGVFLDLSHILGWCSTNQILRILSHHDMREILFGTDAPWQDPASILAQFHALGLAAHEEEAFLSGNACALFPRITPIQT